MDIRTNKQCTAILLLIFCGIVMSTHHIAAQQKGDKHLIFADTFDHGLDTTVWIAEIEPLPGSTVTAQKGKLVLDTRGGVTVWLNKMLKGNIQIEYKRRVMVEGGSNDRLSDLNQFWMASDPHNKDLFTRNGKFEEYDSLQLYYVGIGGNTNTTTRFRKYTGTGERLLLHEYTDVTHLLQPGREYHIRIIIQNSTVSFYVDNICYFKYEDPAILQSGYFGFRATASRHEIDDIKVYQLDN